MTEYIAFKAIVRHNFTMSHPHMTKAEYLGTMVNKCFHGWRNYYALYCKGLATTGEWT